MTEGLNIDSVVLQELEKQVDLLTSQRDILTRLERLLTRLIDVQTPAPQATDAGRGHVESFFAKDR